jgi:hypothetical protein
VFLEVKVVAMRLPALLLLSSVFATVVAAAATAAAATSAPSVTSFSDCAAAGFVAGALDCGTCASLAAALGSSSEEAACRACCSDVVGLRSLRRFESARLEVPRAMGGLGGLFGRGGGEDSSSPWSGASAGVREWIEKGSKRWPQVEIVTGEAVPTMAQLQMGAVGGGGANTLVLLSDDEDEEPVRIDVSSFKWEVLDAFLKRKLQ